jgi:phosphatidylserine/phosphatidylglycerophosphate/cardiolipin synthase-like enzyme
LALVALAVTACGQTPSLIAPMNASDAMPEFEDLAKPSTPAAIRVDFNNTYKERIDLNEPLARKDPRNTDKALLKLIRTAKQTIDGAFYDIGDPGVTKELVKAKIRGVRVRLITDTDNVVDKEDPTKPRQTIADLRAADVDVVEDKRSGIMHHKFMVVDGQIVWTGSTNLTTTSLYAHNNNALTIKSRELADAYSDEFTRLFVRKEFGASMRPQLDPVKPVQIGKATVRVFFSPRGGGRNAVVEQLKKAERRIRFMTFSLTDAETGDTIMQKAQAGLLIDGIFDRWLAAGQYSLFSKFKAAKMNVVKDGNEALMHHKVILIDNDTLITGSYNYSQNAEANNNEAFLIVENSTALNGAFSKEVDRLAYAAKHNRPPAHKKPDDPENKTGEGP